MTKRLSLGAVGELGGDGGVGAALDLFGGLGVEPGGAVELAGHGDSSRGAGAPVTTRGLIVSRTGSPSPPVHFRPTAEAGEQARRLAATGSLAEPGDRGLQDRGGQRRGEFDTAVGYPVMLAPADDVWTLLPVVGAPP